MKSTEMPPPSLVFSDRLPAVLQSLHQMRRELTVNDLEPTWQSMKQTALDQLRQVMGGCILPADLPELQQMINDFCDLQTPGDSSELAERTRQLNRIIEKAGTSS